MELTSAPGVRIFSTSEANSLVPALQLSFAAIGQIRTELEGLLTGLAAGDPSRVVGILRGELAPEPAQEESVVRLQVLVLELGQAVEGLADMGVIVKDLDPGLVDIPTEMDGRLVMLCWQFGEPGVHWFHETEEGFEERHPLPDAAPVLH
ncbi:DUF2203 domain-containing protein [Vulgatibacter sp.]|uniref:DUF2203 domain-containing protein n=1 Tax=Vulgatibacter sp. TaxID=1971226 RepID=UPI003569099E